MVKYKIEVECRKGWWVVMKNNVPTHETSQRKDWAQEKAEKMAKRISKRENLTIKTIAKGVYDLC